MCIATQLCPVTLVESRQSNQNRNHISSPVLKLMHNDLGQQIVTAVSYQVLDKLALMWLRLIY